MSVNQSTALAAARASRQSGGGAVRVRPRLPRESVWTSSRTGAMLWGLFLAPRPVGSGSKVLP